MKEDTSVNAGHFLTLTGTQPYARRMRVRMMSRYLIFVALLINGDNKFGDVCDDFVALSFPQRVHADLQVFHQHFLNNGRKRNVLKMLTLTHKTGPIMLISSFICGLW